MLDYEEPTNEQRLETLRALSAVGISPGGALTHLTDDVRAFHTLFGHPAPRKPVMQTPALVERRAKWIRSEVEELEEATSVAEQADAYIDIIYFAVGGLVELGIKFTHKLWRLVQTANLSKVWPDGSVRKNEVGKVIKPEHWVSPDAAIVAAIEAETHGNAAPEAAQNHELNCLGDEAVQRLSAAAGEHVHVLLFAIGGESGKVASTSDLDMQNQRDFLRYLTQSLAAGDVLVEHEGMTRQ